jgi:hypothetical protein
MVPATVPRAQARNPLMILGDEAGDLTYLKPGAVVGALVNRITLQ